MRTTVLQSIVFISPTGCLIKNNRFNIHLHTTVPQCTTFYKPPFPPWVVLSKSNRFQCIYIYIYIYIYIFFFAQRCSRRNISHKPHGVSYRKNNTFNIHLRTTFLQNIVLYAPRSVVSEGNRFQYAIAHRCSLRHRFSKPHRKPHTNTARFNIHLRTAVLQNTVFINPTGCLIKSNRFLYAFAHRFFSKAYFFIGPIGSLVAP